MKIFISAYFIIILKGTDIKVSRKKSFSLQNQNNTCLLVIRPEFDY